VSALVINDLSEPSPLCPFFSDVARQTWRSQQQISAIKRHRRGRQLDGLGSPVWLFRHLPTVPCHRQFRDPCRCATGRAKPRVHYMTRNSSCPVGWRSAARGRVYVMRRPISRRFLVKLSDVASHFEAGDQFSIARLPAHLRFTYAMRPVSGIESFPCCH
jgi:hypothetical protein